MRMRTDHNFYVVWRGVIPGIFEEWDDIEYLVRDVEGAKYSGFDSFDKACEAFLASPREVLPTPDYVGQSGLILRHICPKKDVRVAGSNNSFF